MRRTNQEFMKNQNSESKLKDHKITSEHHQSQSDHSNEDDQKHTYQYQKYKKQNGLRSIKDEEEIASNFLDRSQHNHIDNEENSLKNSDCHHIYDNKQFINEKSKNQTYEHDIEEEGANYYDRNLYEKKHTNEYKNKTNDNRQVNDKESELKEYSSKQSDSKHFDGRKSESRTYFAGEADEVIYNKKIHQAKKQEQTNCSNRHNNINEYDSRFESSKYKNTARYENELHERSLLEQELYDYKPHDFRYVNPGTYRNKNYEQASMYLDHPYHINRNTSMYTPRQDIEHERYLPYHIPYKKRYIPTHDLHEEFHYYDQLRQRLPYHSEINSQNMIDHHPYYHKIARNTDSEDMQLYEKIHRNCDENKRRPRVRECNNCGTTNTPSWRRGKDKKQLLCNACGLYSKLHNRDRPYKPKATGKKTLKQKIGRFQCKNCKVIETSYPRLTADGSTLCNSCGLHYGIVQHQTLGTSSNENEHYQGARLSKDHESSIYRNLNVPVGLYNDLDESYLYKNGLAQNEEFPDHVRMHVHDCDLDINSRNTDQVNEYHYNQDNNELNHSFHE